MSEKYKEAPEELTPLMGLTESYWMLSKLHEKYNQLEESKKTYTKSLKYLAEYEKAMEDAWPQRYERISDNNMLHIIKFYHHIDKNIPKTVEWRKKYLEILMNRWTGGQKDRETACWIHNMYGTLATYTRGISSTEGNSYQNDYNEWVSVIKTFPVVEGRKRRCYLPYYF